MSLFFITQTGPHKCSNASTHAQTHACTHTCTHTHIPFDHSGPGGTDPFGLWLQVAPHLLEGSTKHWPLTWQLGSEGIGGLIAISSELDASCPAEYSNSTQIKIKAPHAQSPDLPPFTSPWIPYAVRNMVMNIKYHPFSHFWWSQEHGEYGSTGCFIP